jgi:hypothetical protein
MVGIYITFYKTKIATLHLSLIIWYILIHYKYFICVFLIKRVIQYEFFGIIFSALKNYLNKTNFCRKIDKKLCFN